MGEEKVYRESKEDQTSPESSAGKPSLRRSIELITSLISLSHSTKVFAVKWQMIRNKLEELNSGLTAAENCDDSCENPALSDLIPLITATVNDCYDLARRCVNLSYSGKLLMQSDLDVIAAKFDRHVKNLSGTYTFTNGYAIVVSRPGLGGCRDDMRFYIRDLLTRLKIGDSEMKRQALVALKEVITEDEKNIKIVIDIDDVVNVLANFLDSQVFEIQELTTEVISVVSGFDLYKGVLIGAGVIAPLIRVLECGSDRGRECAARCLRKLTENGDNAWSVSAHGGVTAILKICTSSTSGDTRGGLISPACGVLRNLVGVEEIKRFMVEEGAIATFVKLARSKDEVTLINSIEFLQTMAFGDESIRQLVIREGGIHALVRVLDPKSSFSSKTREIALRAIENLCFSSMSSINILMSYGFMDQLLFFLRNGEVSVQELALKAAFQLCGTSEESKKAMGDAGFMPEFVRLLDAKSFEIREMAAEALSSMVLVPRNRRRFSQEDRNIGLLLQLLDPEEGNSGNRKFLLSTLISLSSCNSGRRKIVNSGYLKNIEKLAEAEVLDAKRIVRKLSMNRFRSMLSGIWHF